MKSLNALFDIIQQFEKCSSLNINLSKTEILRIGDAPDGDFRHNLNFVDVINVLGTYVGIDSYSAQVKKAEEMLSSLQFILNMWKMRNLTIFGKIQIIKSFGISKFMYLFSSVILPKWFLKKMESMFFKFIWNGPDKIRRNVMIQDLSDGGIKMVDVLSAASAQQLYWIQRIREADKQGWFQILQYYLKKNGGLFMFNCNYSHKMINGNIPKFYRVILEQWASLNVRNREDSTKFQIIWNNRQLQVNQDMIFFRKLFLKRIVFFNDILTEGGQLKQMDEMKRLFNLDANDYFRLQGVYYSLSEMKIPKIIYAREFQNDVISSIILPPELIHFTHLRSKHFYDILVAEKYEQPVSTFRIKNRYDISDKELSLARLFIVSTTIDVKYREFQFKVINNILNLNYKLYKMKLIDSPLCSLCNLENETTEHLFWNCSMIQDFWNQLGRVLDMFDFSILTEKTVILGLLTKDCSLFNFILLVAKKTIYLSRFKSVKPTIFDFISLLLEAYKMEKYISMRNNKMSIHANRWQSMAHWISTYNV